MPASVSTSSAPETAKLSMQIEFLNELSETQINDFKAHILKKGKYKLSINSKNLDEDITPQELHSFTSVTSQDGN
jgi:hypothetical protein